MINRQLSGYIIFTIIGEPLKGVKNASIDDRHEALGIHRQEAKAPAILEIKKLYLGMDDLGGIEERQERNWFALI